MSTQAFVRWNGHTFTFTVDHRHSIDSLKENIYKVLGIPINDQLLKCHSLNHWQRESQIFVDLNLRLVGGKGGYGYLLRSGSSGIKKKKSSNYSSCRNLDGRRIRDVELMEQLSKQQKSEDPNKIDLGDEVEEEEIVEYETQLVNGKLKKKPKKKKRKQITEEDKSVNEFQLNKTIEKEKKIAKQKEVIEDISDAIEVGLEKSKIENTKPKSLDKGKKIFGDDMFSSDDEM